MLMSRPYRLIVEDFEGVSIMGLGRHKKNHFSIEQARKAERYLTTEGGLSTAYGRLGIAKPNGLQLQRFVDELLADAKLNQTKAAIRAGCSKTSAASTANEWLKRDDVRAAIVERQTDRKTRTEVRQDAIIDELARLAYADFRDLVSWEETGKPTLTASRNLGPEARAIKALKISRNGDLTLQMHDKKPFFQMLLDHLGKDAPAAGAVFRVVMLDPKTGQEVAMKLPRPARHDDED